MRQQYSTQLAIAAGVLILIASTVFAMVQSPELLEVRKAAAIKSATPIPHGIKDLGRCERCHALEAENPYPLKDAGWSIASCVKCHSPAKKLSSADTLRHSPPVVEEQDNRARSIPHPVRGMKNCTDCHGLDGEIPYTENHVGRDNDSCVHCHETEEMAGRDS